MYKKVNDTFAQGEQRLADALRRCSAEPGGYVPQHDKAHVHLPRQGFKNGYPICFLNRRAS